MNQSKKLIEVALPLDAINKASAKEKSIRHGHPSTLHLWWARRPLAAARAVIFAQMVDDPSSHPELFPTEKLQDEERQRLFRLIEELVKWENSSNESLLAQAREEIWKSWRSTCDRNASSPRAMELFDSNRLPRFHDPFAGGGALPLEAQRLGLRSHATELNPVAVLLNKAMIEIPSRFSARPPVNPSARSDETLFSKKWVGPKGLAEDVQFYSDWMREEATKRLAHLYPSIEITADLVNERPDLERYLGHKLTVVAWLWARTVASPNPAFATVEVPLASTFMVSEKVGHEAYVEPLVGSDGYRFEVKLGKPVDIDSTRGGTKYKGSNFRCLMSGVPINGEYIKAEGQAGRMGVRMMAVVAQAQNSRVYLSPTPAMEEAAANASPKWRPAGEVPARLSGGTCVPYGLKEWGDLFTDRQLVALTTFSDLVQESRKLVLRHASEAGLSSDEVGFEAGGNGAVGYADAVAVYLALSTDRLADRNSSLCSWDLAQAVRGREATIRNVFARQAIPMVWDFAEVNILAETAGSFDSAARAVIRVVERLNAAAPGFADQADAATASSEVAVVSTDPPYYDNISYADLSDFFYVWLRYSLKSTFPKLFATVSVPKTEELVATAYRHGSKAQAETFFLNGMTRAMERLAEQAQPDYPITIYYAFKQSETSGEGGVSSTGWETFLDAVIRAGFALTGTWPMRTELSNRMIGSGTNALASSIVLVCRPRDSNAKVVTRREFINQLKSELPEALILLQRGNIAPVDLAQASIGPGMAVYTRYSKVIDAEGKTLSVREALKLINQSLDEVLSEQEGDFDAETRWALAWFEQYGFAEGEYGVADTLSKAKNTSVAGLAEVGIVSSRAGRVRLLPPIELPHKWDPSQAKITVWEIVHHLIRALETGGESAAAQVFQELGLRGATARELPYRLYAICERTKRTKEAISYNGLVQSWPEISRLSSEIRGSAFSQAQLF